MEDLFNTETVLRIVISLLSFSTTTLAVTVKEMLSNIKKKDNIIKLQEGMLKGAGIIEK